MMTPATEAKAAAINLALRRNNQHTVDSLALLLALLTSANKEEREVAKREVRDIVRIGSNLLTAKCTTGVDADTLEDAIAIRVKSTGHKHKPWTPTR